MPVDHGHLIRLYDVHPLLGRQMVLDARSLDYVVDASADVPIVPRAWDPAIGILDQSNLDTQGIDVTQLFPGTGVQPTTALGSCVGQATTYALSALGIGAVPSDLVEAEKYAVRRYSAATKRDEILAYQYPVIDSGSSGLGSCRALQQERLIRSYQWATNRRGIGVLMQTGGILIGLPWYNSMFEPDSDGFIDAGGPEVFVPSGLAGGHELYAARLEAWKDDDPNQCILAGPNSWGPWGDSGWWRMRLSTYEALQRDVDVKAFVL